MPEVTLDRRIAWLAERQHGAFARCQALDVGFTPDMVRHRLRTGRWRVVVAGTYRIAGTRLGPEGLAMAATLAAGPGAVASHRTAGVLWGLDRVPAPNLPEVIVGGRRRVRRTGVLIHLPCSFACSDATELDGIPITTPARTVLDLAGCLHPSVLERVLDSALRRELVDVDGMLERVVALRRCGRPGLAALQEMLEVRRGRPVTGSTLETDFDLIFRQGKLPLPELQYVIRDRRGRFIGRVDFVYPAERIAIEIDSYTHHHGRQAFDADRDRMARLAAEGWLPMPLTDQHRKEPERARELIRSALASRSAG